MKCYSAMAHHEVLTLTTVQWRTMKCSSSTQCPERGKHSPTALHSAVAHAAM